MSSWINYECNLQKIAAAIGIPLAGIAGTAQLAGVAGEELKECGCRFKFRWIWINRRRRHGSWWYSITSGEWDSYGMNAPLGDPLSVLSPLGLDAGRRLRSVKDAETLRDATNILLPTVRKFSEQAKRDDFARDMASAGIKQNILTNAALTENMQRAGLNMGMNAANQAGAALTARYNY